MLQNLLHVQKTMAILHAHDTMTELLSKQEKATIAPRILDLLEAHTKEKITVLTHEEDVEDEGYYNFLPISDKVIENTLGKSMVVVEF